MIVLCLVAVFCGLRHSMKHGYLANSIARNMEEKIEATEKENLDEGWDSWLTYQKPDAQGKLKTECYYHYPEIARKYGVPETWFRKEGIRHCQGRMDNLSYTVICKPYVDDRTGNVYMESACAIYTNGQRDDSDDTREKVTNGRMAYRVTINGSLYNNIIYVSPCMYFFPAGEKSKQGIKTAELRLTEKNPNILDSADMICWVGRAGNFNKEGKTSVSDKTISAMVDKNMNFYTNGGFRIDYTEVVQEQNGDDGCGYRTAEADFLYGFSAFGLEETYTDHYKITYNKENDGKIHLEEELEEGAITVWNSHSLALVDDQPVEPKVTVYYGIMPLEEGKQYTVTYKNNDKAGTSQIIIKGIGNYTGTITSEFEIFDPEENK